MYDHLSREELIQYIKRLQRELNLMRGMSDTAKSVSPGAASDTLTNRMYDELFEFLPLPAFETDSDGYLTRVNARSLAQFGYELHEVLYRKQIYDVLRQDSLHRMKEGFEARRRGIKSTGNEYVGVRRDGSEFESLIYSEGIFVNGVFQGIRGVLIDISDRVALENDREVLAEQLRHARRVESVGRLAAGVAHDFNNLLSPIIGYSEVVIEQLGPSHPILEDMREILASAHSAREITQQLLTFGQKQHVQKERLNLNDIIRDTAQLVRRLVPESIYIEYAYSSDACDILGDGAQLKQILLNLFINAGDAISGRGRILVQTEVRELEHELQTRWSRIPPGKYVILTVIDDGRGMDEETQEHIFEPFFSTKKLDGTGLGLSTVWGIAKQHDSYIKVETHPRQGTTFSVWFPLLSMSDAIEAMSGPAAMPSNGKRVLVVDDDKRMCRLVRRLLTQQGYAVEMASGVQEARAMMHLHRNRFNLLLADVILPELDGKQLADELCARAPGMRVLYMTGYGPDMLADCNLSDEPNILHKPFDVETLVTRVKKVLE
ncbi:MAG: response regulator [Deltaproteobacteria bacterium]|nr:response regulator [Deltaproteobacteria bacterium]